MTSDAGNRHINPAGVDKPCPDVNPSQVPSPSDTRQALLNAAYRRAVAGEWGLTRMADVATEAGVSRQTLYNEFGSKDGLARALVLRETHRFIAGVREVLDEHLAAGAGGAAGIGDAVAAAAGYVFDRAADDPLIKAVLTSDQGGSLLPFLTTRSEPVLVASRDAVVDYLARACPQVASEDIRVAAEAAVRLTVSHVVLPLTPADTAARELASLVTRYLTGGQP